MIIRSQSYSLYLASISSTICLILVYFWATGGSSVENYLGGLTLKSPNLCTWHAALMITGMCFCLIQAAVSFRLFRIDHYLAKLLHFFWHSCAIILSISGIVCMFKFKRDNVHLSNISSLHSWLGLCTLILYGQNYVLGFLYFLSPIFKRQVDMKRNYLRFHKYFGYMTLVSAVVTMQAGIVQKNKTGGCSYRIYKVDNDPASHYHDIPNGCKLSMGIGILMTLALCLFFYGTVELVPGDRYNESSKRSPASSHKTQVHVQVISSKV